jgi:hypothetical protein
MESKSTWNTVDHVGKTYRRWYVSKLIRSIDKSGKRRRRYRCICACGTIKIMLMHNILNELCVSVASHTRAV